MWSYLRNQPSKQTNFVYLQFLSNYALFSKNWCRKLLKNLEYESLFPLNYRLTGHPENFKIKLYYFQERLNVWYNIILKLQSLFHIYVSGKITDFQKDLFFKKHSWSQRFSISFSILSIIVPVISYFHI